VQASTAAKAIAFGHQRAAPFSLQNAGIDWQNQYVAARKPPQWPRDAHVRIGRGQEYQEKQL